jgi:DNA invertase Pin-like site-specific DNA recombinase
MTTPTIPNAPTPDNGVGYSYVRFSAPKQAEGDSLRRQTELAADYCRRHGLTLDTSLNLKDLGVSAFRGKNALVGNLGVFLDAIRRQTVKPGSRLIVESLDRISRQGIDEGYDICKRILKAGVHIVTLHPERDFGTDSIKGLTKGALELQIILERAAEESEMKSQRVSAAWSKKRDRVRQGECILTRKLPRWVRAEGGKLVLIEDRAATVKMIFELAAGGYGSHLICQYLNDHHVAAFDAPRWCKQYVTGILKDRAVLGEVRLRGRGCSDDDPPIPDYFPRVVSQAEFDAARAGIEQRRGNPRQGDQPPKYPYATRPKRDPDAKRRRNFVNLFQGLLIEARSGDQYVAATRTDRTRKLTRVFVTSCSTRGQGEAWGFPADVLEQVLLSHLKEINPAELTPDDERGPDSVMALEGRLADVRQNIAQLAEIQSKVPTLTTAQIIAAKEVEVIGLEAELERARRAVGGWSEAQSLVRTLETAGDPRDARLRLRSALRRIVKEIRVKVVPSGMTRYAFVQLSFVGGDRLRHYLIRHDPAWSNGLESRAASWLSVIVTQDVGDLTVEAVEKILAWSE